MASLDHSLFKCLAPEFKNVPNSTLDKLSPLAENCVDKDVYGDSFDHALALLVAHMLTMSGRGGTGGAVTMEKVGDLQRQFATVTGLKNSIDMTSYGQEFKRVSRKIVTSPLIVC